MPNATVTVAHQLRQDEALTRVQAAIAQLAAQFSGEVEVRGNWNGYVGSFVVSGRGQQAPATVGVNPYDVTVEVALPFWAFAYKTKVEAKIRDVLMRVIAR